MKLCITAVGKDLDARIDTRLGRAPYFLLIDTASLSCEAIANPACASGRGAGIRAAQTVADRGAEAVLTGQVGPNAFRALQAAGIKVFEGASPGLTAREAVAKFNKDEFTETTAPSADTGCGPGMDRGRGWRGGRCRE